MGNFRQRKLEQNSLAKELSRNWSFGHWSQINGNGEGKVKYAHCINEQIIGKRTLNMSKLTNFYHFIAYNT